MNWLRHQFAGWCIRAALHLLPPGKSREALATHLDQWMTERLDPLGVAGRVVTVHRREIGMDV